MDKLLTEYLFEDAFLLFVYRSASDCDVSFLDEYISVHGFIVQSRTYFKEFEVIDL